MNKTLRMSFSLKNTYRVNSILYSIKQIPLIKKLLPATLYSVHGLKVFANIISVFWEIISGLLGKLLYILLMVVVTGGLYEAAPKDRLFVHMLLFLSIIGAINNTYMFNPTRDKYYAMFLMRMDAKEYTLINYGYAMLKMFVGFLIFGVIFGIGAGVPLLICILFPFFVAGLKMTVAAYSLQKYKKKGISIKENTLGKPGWVLIILLLAAAYGLPAAGFVLPLSVAVVFMLLTVLASVPSFLKILSFKSYREVYQDILNQFLNQIDAAKKVKRNMHDKNISADTKISSGKSGFEYLNELFIKRHQNILWKSTKKITLVCLCLILGALLAFYLLPEIKDKTNELLLTYLPYMVIVMYAINRGTGFTTALFMNCDHSLLTYSFYKQPKFILKLFQIRLREIMKVNLLPAMVIGIGLALLLYFSGGTDNALNYLVLIMSVPALSVFFSVHYLTIYYLLQPYNMGTEMKSATYQIVHTITYVVCLNIIRFKMMTIVFGLTTITFCVLYCIVASVLVYKFAPKTFRLRV